MSQTFVKSQQLLFCWTDIVLHRLPRTCYGNRLVHLSTLIREASLYSRWWFTQRPKTHQTCKECWAFSRALDTCVIHSSSQGSVILSLRWIEWMWLPCNDYTDTLHCSHNRAVPHINCDNCSDSTWDKNLSTERGRGKALHCTLRWGAVGKPWQFGKAESVFLRKVSLKEATDALANIPTHMHKLVAVHGSCGRSGR